MWLAVLDGLGPAGVFPLVPGQTVGIGRDQNAEVVVRSTSVSRRHCEVTWDGCRVWVRDLNSRCGTHVNGKDLRDGKCVREPEGRLLRPGDVIYPGPVRVLLGTSARVEPACLDWGDGIARKLAVAIDEEGAFDRLPILGDALEEAGCVDAAVLGHLRGPGPHACGCWALQLILARS